MYLLYNLVLLAVVTAGALAVGLTGRQLILSTSVLVDGESDLQFCDVPKFLFCHLSRTHLRDAHNGRQFLANPLLHCALKLLDCPSVD